MSAMANGLVGDKRMIRIMGAVQDCLKAAGFDPGLTFSGMLAGAETYAANLEEAVTQGVFGAPFYIVGDQRFWGQDRLEFVLKEAQKK